MSRATMLMALRSMGFGGKMTGQGMDPAQRVVGSVAFTAVARVVLVAAKVKSLEDGQDARILARSKSNIGPDDGGFNYHLEQCEPLPGIHASRIAWGACDHWGDTPQAREQMRQDCLNTPPNQRADLLAHFKSTYGKKP
jgi:hypothetical protein